MIEVFYSHDHHTNTAGFYCKQLLLVETVSSDEGANFS